MYQVIINQNEAEQRFDKFLHKYLKTATSGFLYKMLRKKNITLNLQKAEGKEILKRGDTVTFFFSEDTYLKFRGDAGTDAGMETEIYLKACRSNTGIQVVYENEHILLLNKPAGLLTQKAGADDISLNEWMIGYLLQTGSLKPLELATFRPSVCNRLDRNTSGLVICGKSLKGSQEMSRLLKERTLHKYYRLFVRGQMENAARVEGYLIKDPVTNKVSVTDHREDNEALKIQTRYEPIALYRDYSYIEVELITGKTHQIRAHLASCGYPLLGDGKYGDESFNAEYRKAGVRHQMLHAYRLVFPQMEEPLCDLSGREFTAEEPDIFELLRKGRRRGC